jgi:hypothetical protein
LKKRRRFEMINDKETYEAEKAERLTRSESIHLWRAIEETRAALCELSRQLNGETPSFKEPIPYDLEAEDLTQGFRVEDRGEPRPVGYPILSEYENEEDD